MNDLLSPSDIGLTSQDMVELEKYLQHRLSGLVSDFRLIVAENGIVLRGCSRTFDAKKLAAVAVREATECPILANEIDVPLD